MRRLGYRARRRLALLWLLVGLPVYIVLAVHLAERIGRPGIALELAIYIILGIVWALPLRAVFRGVGRPDPDAAGRRGP